MVRLLVCFMAMSVCTIYIFTVDANHEEHLVDCIKDFTCFVVLLELDNSLVPSEFDEDDLEILKEENHDYEFKEEE